jgi:hypothetical protein
MAGLLKVAARDASFRRLHPARLWQKVRGFWASTERSTQDTAPQTGEEDFARVPSGVPASLAKPCLGVKVSDSSSGIASSGIARPWPCDVSLLVPQLGQVNTIRRGPQHDCKARFEGLCHSAQAH